MSLTASDKGGADFEMTPEGTYVARCYKIIDLGTQKGSEAYGGKEQHKVMIGWELLDNDVKMEDGRPFTVNQFYTVSLHEKSKLRKDLEAWRGKKFTAEELAGFDLANVLGVYCMLQVVHSEDGKYANVNAIMSYKGEKPKPVNDNVVFDIDEPDMAVFETMSDNMKGKIMTAPEWKGSKQTASMAPATKAEDLISTPAKKDTVVTNFNDEPISLDDIPF